MEANNSILKNFLSWKFTTYPPPCQYRVIQGEGVNLMMYPASLEPNQDIFVFYWSMSPNCLWNILLEKTLTLRSLSEFERERGRGEKENLDTL